jgi:hypothetical protein
MKNTNDLQDRLNAMAEASKIRAQAAIEAKQSHRLMQWHAVKTQAPEIADFMQDIAKAFGKPARVTVVLNSGEVILDSAGK